MEEAEVVPSELFIKLGLLVVESRVPEASPKGRREGPHCPNSTAPDAQNHTCKQSDFLCKRSAVLEKQMSLLWKNRIPMCIEVLMYSHCEHGHQRVQNLDFSLPTNKADCVLLEQWNIQVMPRRHGEAVVRVRELLQALRSYLYFSQISAWLNVTHGQAPANVAYRISPPGEFCTSSFQETPEWHTFPLCGIGKSASLKVTVGVLQRRADIILVPCPQSHTPECSEAAKFRKREVGESHSQRHVTQNLPPKSLELQTTDLRFPTPTVQHPTTTAARSSPSREAAHAPSPHPDSSYAICKQKNTGAIPKRYMHKSPPHWGYEYHTLSTPNLQPLSRSPELDSKVSLLSPKVLLSKKSPGQAYYKKDEHKWVTAKTSKDSDSDHSSPEIDLYLKNIRTNLEPLSPEEIQTYLANLSIEGRSGSTPKDLSPLTGRDLSPKAIPTLNKMQLYTPNDSPSPSSVSSPERIKLNFTDLDDKPKSFTRKKSPQWSSEDLQGEDLTPTGSPRRSPNQGKSLVKRAESPLTRLLRESALSTSPVSDKSSDKSSPDSPTYSNGSSHSENSVANGSTIHKISDLPQEEQVATSVIYDKVSFSIGGEDDDSGLSSGMCSVKSEQSSDLEKGSESDCGVSHDDLPDLSSPFSPTFPSPGFDLPSQSRVQKSRSEGGHLSSLSKSNALFKTLLRKDLPNNLQGADTDSAKVLPSQEDEETFRINLQNSAKKLFHSRTGLPLQSSPAPIKRRTSTCFDFDSSLVNVRAIKNSFSCVNLDEQNKNADKDNNKTPQRFYSTSAPASTNSLLGSFEESILNGRLEPSGVVNGFTAEIGASGAFCPKHLNLPVTAFFFNLSDDNAPSPYLGHINLDHLGKRGYHIPKKGTIQVTLFNPNKTVVKMFVVVYDLSEMPSNCQTFIRQRTLYMPVKGSPSDLQGEPVYLRYLIHLRFSSSKSGKIYLHTDLRLIFARDKLEFDNRVANYELRSFTEGPTNPKFSPKR